MYRRFLSAAALSALGFALSVVVLPTSAEAGPVVRVAIGTPPIVVATPRINISVGPNRPGPNYRWVEGYWIGDGHGHRTWVAGYWRPTTRVVTVRRAAPVVHHHRVRSGKVTHHR